MTAVEDGRNPRADWLDAVRRLSRLLADAGDLETFAAALNEYLCRTFAATASSLILVDPQTDELIFHTASGVPSTILNQTRLRRGEGLAGWVCEHHQSVNVPDARQDQRFCQRVDAVTGFFTRSVMCAPLFRQGLIEGAIEVLNRADGEPFGNNDLELLEVIAEQVELLVANVKLIGGLQRRNQELSTLIEIDRAVNASHSLDELLGTILASATAVARAAGSSVILREPASDELIFFHAVGPAKSELANIRMPAGTGIVGHCIATGQPVYVANAYEDERFAKQVDTQTGFRTTSLLAVPLLTGEQVIGALEVVNLENTEQPEQMLGLMEAFASQVAVAIERARLYDELAQRVDQATRQLRSTNVSLANEKAKLTAMIEQMADGVIMIDGDGRLLLVNDAARELFELGDAELEGRPALAVTNPGLAAVLAVGETGPGGLELSFERPVERTVRVHSATVESPETRIGKVVVITDITELKELAEIRSELVSFVSHELRTPLTSIKGFVSVLLNERGVRDPDQRGFVQIIDHECDRLRRMVADLLCMTRIDSGRALEVHWMRVDVGRIVEHVCEAQRIYSGTRTIALESPPEPVIADADQDKIEQILTNLVNNAIKYSPPESTVTVTVETAGDEVVVAVRDEGYGIAPEDLPHLFTQYGRVGEAQRRRIRGTGLGLYLSRHLAEALEGSLEVTSELGRGSTFTFRWPRRRRWDES